MSSTRGTDRAILALAAVLASGLWAISWGFNAQTAEGNLAVLGLSEGEWRALLNPALLTAVAASITWAAPRRRADGVLIVGGLIAMLAGNLLEFGVSGRPMLTDLGWLILLVGGAVALLGMGAVVTAGVSQVSQRRALGAIAGVAVVLATGLAAVAVPAVASVALLPIADGLWRAAQGEVSPEARTSGAVAPAYG